MRNLLITLAVALAACAGAFGVFYAINDVPAMHRAAREQDAMAWLRTEFNLDDAHFTAVKKLHDDYGVVCVKHCAAIMNAKERAATPAEIAALEKTCVDAMTAHFRQVAGVMPAAEGTRYLATVLPRIKDFGHESVPNLRGTP
jgi:hypothetical protein